MTKGMQVPKVLKMSHYLFLAGGITALCDQIKIHWFLAIWHNTSCILDHIKQVKQYVIKQLFWYNFSRIV